MRHARFLLLAPFLLAASSLVAQTTALPRTHAPAPTSSTITAADLMTRLYIFADDSMLGRETGTVGHLKSTDYIARELQRLGLEPAGDNGSYFQALPMIRRAFDVASIMTVGGVTLRGGVDFVASTRGGASDLDGVQVIFGGTALDTVGMLTEAQVRGKLVVLLPASGGGGRGAQFGRRGAFRAFSQALGSAAAIATITDELDPAMVQSLTHPREGDVFMQPSDGAGAPATLTITPHAAAVLLGRPPEAAAKGQLGKTVTGRINFMDEPAPARNVVAILRGSDPALRGEYVAIGSHTDHTGLLQGSPVDHDSLHLYNEARFAIVGMVSRGERPTPEQQAQVAAIALNLDSIRAVRPARADSLRNGADDDGSGSVTMLELAEAFARTDPKPKRSILFVWHTGEEKGLLGSRWFSEHPTVPRDAIVAQLNMDMVGRGAASDLPVGSPDYVALVGSRRLSTELGDLVETVNAASAKPLQFD
ncbi:MAG: M20/M25/M40 family metallo-hydrolase, partial [Gemmatimonadota bacterium]|nr:M20/M25/M40 family metallo-hydrolase [Gemmatimonadota bacterium]